MKLIGLVKSPKTKLIGLALKRVLQPLTPLNPYTISHED